MDKIWGVKRICSNCNSKYYDFNKMPIICPVCSSPFMSDNMIKRKMKHASEAIDSQTDDDLDDQILDEDTDNI